MDRADRHGPAPESNCSKHRASCAEDGSSVYGSVQHRPEACNHQQEGGPGSRDGEPWAEMKPQHVLAPAVSLRDRADSYAAKQTAAYFQIPSLLVTPPAHHAPARPHHRFQRMEY